jgi:hypothetical protein
MTRGQKHLLGFALPAAASTTSLALAPEHDPPVWMIGVAAAGFLVATGYALFAYGRFANRGGNYIIAPAAMFGFGAAGWLLGLTQQSATLVALGGLVPASGTMLAFGYCRRAQGKSAR